MRLAEQLQRSWKPKPQVRFGTVTSVSTGICTVQVAGGEIPAITLKGAPIAVGDFVAVQRQGVVSYVLVPPGGLVLYLLIGVGNYGPGQTAKTSAPAGVLLATGPGGTDDNELTILGNGGAVMGVGSDSSGSPMLMPISADLVNGAPTYVSGVGPLLSFTQTTQLAVGLGNVPNVQNPLITFDTAGQQVGSHYFTPSGVNANSVGAPVFNPAGTALWLNFQDSNLGYTWTSIVDLATGAVTAAVLADSIHSMPMPTVDDAHGIGYVATAAYSLSPTANVGLVGVSATTAQPLWTVSFPNTSSGYLQGAVADTKRQRCYIAFVDDNQASWLATVSSTGSLLAQAALPSGQSATGPAAIDPQNALVAIGVSFTADSLWGASFFDPNSGAFVGTTGPLNLPIYDPYPTALVLAPA